jgi:hypothetical protein
MQRSTIMKSLVVILVCLGATVASVPVVSAQETSAGFFCGIVLGVDAPRRILSLEEASFDAEKMNFTVAADAEIRRGTTTIALGDIRVGDPVSVEYEETASGPLAHTVKVITKPDTD